MTGAAIMIIGKLLLTFGVLLGLPLLDLWLMSDRRGTKKKTRSDG